MHGRLPDRVPRLVLADVVVQVDVALHAGGAHPEAVAGAAVVVGIERELEEVVLPHLVTPYQLGADLRRPPIAHDRANVKGAFVEKHADLGQLLGRRVLNRLALHELGGGRRLLPGRFL